MMASRRKRTRRNIVIWVLLGLALAGFGWYWFFSAPAAPDLKISKETTHLTEPVANGRVDYLSALNQLGRRGVTKENNAFIGFAETIPVSRWKSRKHRKAVFKKLGVPVPSPEAPTFRSWKTWRNGRRGKSLPLMSGSESDALAAPWERSAHPEVADWLGANERALESIAEAVRKSRWWVPLVPEGPKAGPLFTMPSPGLGHGRRVARALQARVQRAIGAGDLESAWHDVLTLVRLGRHVQRGPKLTAHLSGISIEAIGSKICSNLAHATALTTKQARSMLESRSGLPEPRSIATTLDRRERLIVLDMLARASSEPRRTVDQVKRKAPFPVRLAPRADRIGVSPGSLNVNVILRRFNERFDELVRAARSASYAQFARHKRELEEELAPRGLEREENIGLLIRARAYLMPPSSRHRWASEVISDLQFAIALPGLTRAIELELRSRMLGRLSRIALALGGYRAQHGRYPAKLAALSPGFLSEVPRDVFVGERLHYEQKGRKWARVYSVGPDQKDDAGHRSDDVVMELGRSPNN